MSMQQVATPSFGIHSHTFYNTKHKGTSLSMPDPPSRNERTGNPHTAVATLSSSNASPASSSLEQPVSTTPAIESSRGSRSSRVHLILNPTEAQQGSGGPQSSWRERGRDGEFGPQQSSSTQLPPLASVPRTQESPSPRDLSTQSQPWTPSYSQPRETIPGRRASFKSPVPAHVQSSSSNPQSISSAAPPLSQPSPWQEQPPQRYFQPLHDSNRPQSQSTSGGVSVEPCLVRPSTARMPSNSTTQSFTADFGRSSRVENIASISSSTRALIQAEQGALGIPVDIQAASRSADEKRRRNAGASARFRARRKEKEQANSREIDDLRQQIRDLTEDSEFYRRERDYFSSVVYQSPDREKHFPRPASPRHRRSSSGTVANFSEASHTSAEGYYQEQTSGGAPHSEGRQARKRARGGETASPSASVMSSPAGSHPPSSSSYALPSFAAPAGDRLPPIQGSSSSPHYPEQQIQQQYYTSATVLPPILPEHFNPPPTRSQDQGQQQQQRPRPQRGGSSGSASYG